jgi:hypothetical protein
MARLISEEIFQDPYFRNLTSIEKLCFIGLFTLAEGTGCLEYDPEGLANKIFSRKDRVGNRKMEEMLAHFIEDGKLILYAVEGKKCLYIRNFAKYQGQSKCPRPRLPLPPWLKWEAYPEKPYLGKVIILENIAQISMSNHCQIDAKNGVHYAEIEHKNATSMSDLCQTSVVSLTNENTKQASNQENFSRPHAHRTAFARIDIDRIGLYRIYNKDSQNENPSLSEKKETYPLSESQSSLSQSLKEQDRSKEEPTPQMLRHPPPTLQEGLEAIPDPEKRQKVKEGIDEFLKTHCV